MGGFLSGWSDIQGKIPKDGCKDRGNITLKFDLKHDVNHNTKGLA
jgi:hypothetical protein